MAKIRAASGGRHGFAQSLFQVGGNLGSSIGPLLAAFVVLPSGQSSIALMPPTTLRGRSHPVRSSGSSRPTAADDVRRETGLVCSVGIGPNKLVAKIASDLDKPDGFCVLSSEMMLEAFGASEENWRDASAPPGFAVSESPRYVGRAVAALAADPNRARHNQRSVTAGELAREHGFTDLDGTQPDAWAKM